MEVMISDRINISTTALIVDDHQIVVDGLSRLLRDEALADDIQTRSSLVALTGQADYRDIRYAIIDIGLAGESGLDAITHLRQSHPALPCVITTGSSLDPSERARLQALTGYFYHKQDPVEGLVGTVRDILAETAPPPPDQPSPVIAATGLGGIGQLTRREREVLRQIGLGNTLAGIADTLGISPATVRKHRENIMDKLEIRSSGKLIRIALQLGLS